MPANDQDPASHRVAPDPASSYGRDHPGRESGMGRLDNNKSTPEDQHDAMPDAVANRQIPERQINAQDTPERDDATRQQNEPLLAKPGELNESLLDEEP